MNALQLAPLGVTTPPGPTGGSPPVGEALSTPGYSKPQPLTSSSHAAQQQRLAEARANTARAAAERKAQAEADAPEAPAPINSFDRKVGLVDGTFKVFVDIVKPPGDEAVVRVFGPPENAPAPQPRSSVAASTAYSRGAAGDLPPKDLGVA